MHADDEMIVAMNQNADRCSTGIPAYTKNSSRFSMHSLRFSELRLFRRARPALNKAREDSHNLTRLSRSCLGNMRECSRQSKLRQRKGRESKMVHPEAPRYTH